MENSRSMEKNNNRRSMSGSHVVCKAAVAYAIRAAAEAGLVIVGVCVRPDGSFELNTELGPELRAEVNATAEAADHPRGRHDRVRHDPQIDLLLAEVAAPAEALRPEVGKRTLTAEAISEALGLSLVTIKQAAANGQLESSCAGNVLRFTPKSLMRSLKGAQLRVQRREREGGGQMRSPRGRRFSGRPEAPPECRV